MPAGDLTQPGGLAHRLARMREATGLTGDEFTAAAGPGWSKSKISKIENGRQMPSKDDIRTWARVCGQPGSVDELLDLREDAQTIRKRWRAQMRAGGAAAVQADIDTRTRAATRIRVANTILMPGLLQTGAYARCMAAHGASINGTTDVDATTAARLARQQVLYEPERTFEFAVTEAGLRMLVCPREVMAGQLDRLAALDLANVTVGIIPMGVELDLPPLEAFTLFDDVAVVESYGGETALGEDESAVYAEVFARLMGEAVTGAEARALIAAAAVVLRS